MRELSKWFDLQVERQDRCVALEDALLANRFLAYAFFRLRFFLGRTLLATVVHFIEFYFLMLMFDGWQLTAAVMLRAAESLLSGFWWGGLEVMRDRIRELQRERRSQHIPVVVSHWMSTARFYAGLTLLLTVGWVVADIARTSQQFHVFHLFVLVAGVRLALSFLLRTYHSGVFAVRRVYRPFGAVVGVDLLGTVGTAMLWPFWEAYSFPIVLLLTTIVANGLTFVYVRRMYDFMGLNCSLTDPGRPVQTNVLQTLSATFLSAGVANAAMSLDGLLVFVLAYGARDDSHNAQWFYMFYLIAPLLRASHDWARLFYFDLKRLDLDLFTNVRRRFSNQVLQIAFAAGALFWLLACVCATVGVGKNLGWIYLLLAALFQIRAHLAFSQLQTFAQKRYGTLLFSGGLMLAALLVSTSAGPAGSTRIGMLSCGLLPVAICLKVASLRCRNVIAETGLISPEVWLSRVAAIHEPIRLRTVRLCHEVTDRAAEQLALEIARWLGPLGDVSQLCGRHIAWYERSKSARSPTNAWLLSTGAGLVESIHDTPWKPSGKDALQELQHTTRCLGQIKAADLNATPTPSTASIIQRFKQICPGGIVWDAATRRDGPMKRLPSSTRRDVMRQAVRHARNFFAGSWVSQYDVTTLLSAGEMRLIFAVPNAGNRKARAEWKSFINSVNVRWAVGTRTKHQERKTMQVLRIGTGTAWFSALGLLVSAMTAVDVDHAVQGTLELKSAVRAEVRAPAAAFLDAVHVAEGDQVDTSTEIAQLRIPELTSRISRGEANLREVEAELSMLESGTRQEELAKQRRTVALLKTEVERCREDLAAALRALRQKLDGLDQQAKEWQARFAFARANYQRCRKLQDSGAIVEEELQEAATEVHVAQAKLGQTAADKRMAQEEGTMQAEAFLARARQDLQEAVLMLALLEAGTRPEEVEAARARRDSIVEELTYLRQLSGQLVLHAGAAGIVTTAGVDDQAGTYLSEGDLICTVEDPSVMEAEILINENDAARVHPGQSVRLKFRSLPYQLLRAKVEAVSVATATDEEGQALTTPTEQRLMIVRCLVEDEPGRLRPGMTGYAKISLGNASLVTIAFDHAARLVRREFWW